MRGTLNPTWLSEAGNDPGEENNWRFAGGVSTMSCIGHGAGGAWGKSLGTIPKVWSWGGMTGSAMAQRSRFKMQ